MKKPEIVVLDSKPLLNDGLSFDALNTLGNLTIYEQTSPSQLVDHAKHANIIITNKVKLGEEQFALLPNLVYVGETATGVDNIDLKAAKNHGITITNVPAYSTDSVAQHVLALLLTHTNQVSAHNDWVQQGDWQAQPYFSYWLAPITELSGLTLGLLGYGEVAQKVAKIANAIGLKVIAHKPHAFSDDDYATWVDFPDLLQESDIVSLHCPLTDKTNKIINQTTLQTMKKSSVLINTGRGGLIDEPALALALKEKQIAAAYLDVLTQEPPEKNNPLIGLTNCIITPHIAWASVAARKRLLNTVCQNIIHFLNGDPVNMVCEK